MGAYSQHLFIHNVQMGPISYNDAQNKAWKACREQTL
jgi:hypothetical protein